MLAFSKLLDDFPVDPKILKKFKHDKILGGVY